jgi:hypothetical protein
MSVTAKTKRAPMPKLSSVTAVGKTSIRVRWKAGRRRGRTEIVDLAPMINAFKFYAPLRTDTAAFKGVRLADGGEVLTWKNGDIDMAATSVERLAEEAMTGSEFKAFLQSHNLTYAAAAALLGRSRRQIAYYVAGASKVIPRLVALACFGFSAREAT